MTTRTTFLLAGVAELSLLPVAWGLGRLLHQPALGTLQWRTGDALLGLVASLPLLLLFWWMWHTRWAPLAGIRSFLETHARPFFGRWSVWQLAVVSCLAGLCEEALFRDVLQTALGQRLGPGWALLCASAGFGLCHWITSTYALLAGLLGVYLGALQLWTGNVLAPMVAHALYDFVALVWFLRQPGTTADVSDTP